jgi:hypothetical protein
MAGQAPRGINNKENFQDRIVVSCGASATLQQQVVFVAPKDLVIDAASIFGTLESDSPTVNAQLFRGTSSDATVAAMVSADLDVTNDVNIGDGGGSPAPFNQAWTVTSDENYLNKGDFLALDLSAAPASIGTYYISLITRSRDIS